MSEPALVPAGARSRERFPDLRAEAPTPIEKAAIILTAVGPEIGGGFLRDLAEDDLIRFAHALTGLGKVSASVLDGVIVEFLESLNVGPDIAGGDLNARKLLGSVLDEAEVTRLLGAATRKPRSVWERLNDTPIAALATFIQAEHPQTATLIVSELRPEVAANVLERLERGFAQTIVLRLSRVPTLDPGVLASVQGAIERDFLSVMQRNMSKRRPAELIAGLMNNIASEARDGFLGYLEAEEPALAQDVLRTMFTFDDIAARISARDVATVLRDVPEEVLLKALKHGEAQESATIGFILGAVPRRLAERYVEDVAAMPEIGRKDGEAAQIEVTNLIQAMVRRGEIKFVENEQ